MITFNPSIFNVKSNFISFKKAQDIQEKPKLSATLAADTFEKTQESKMTSPVKRAFVKRAKSDERFVQTYEASLLLKKERVIPDELFPFVEPIKNDKGQLEFTPLQTRLIQSAQSRMNFYMDIAEQMEKEGADAEEEVFNQVKEVFGGDEGLGKYLVVRHKSKKSIFNKLVKEFKDEYFYGDIMDRFAKDAFKKKFSDLSINEYMGIADKYFKGKTFTKDEYDVLKKPFAGLSKDEKKLILMEIQDGNMAFEPAEIEKCIKMYKHSNSAKEHEKAHNNVKDLIGTRLILPNGNIQELEQVEKYISKAIRYKKLKITKMSNYHDNYILPYIKYDTARKWKDAMPGMVLVENHKVRKRNGYTTTQFNIVHPVQNRDSQKAKDLSKSKVSKKAQNIENNKMKNKFVLGELQIRTKKLNDIGQIEHLIYDILEGKDISKGIPALREYYDSIGIEKAVNEVFNDERKEENYIRYENSMYYWTRHNESKKHTRAYYSKPKIGDYELNGYDVLSFDSLAKIDREAEKIKQTFYKSQNKK